MINSFIYLFLAIIALALSMVVYKKLKNAGKNPWPWTIGTFLLSGVVMVIAMIILFIVNFHR